MIKVTVFDLLWTVTVFVTESNTQEINHCSFKERMLKQRIKQMMLQCVAIAITYLSVTADSNSDVRMLQCCTV